MDHQPEIYKNRLSQSKPSCGNLLDPCPSTLVVWQSSFHPYHQTWTRHCHGGWSKIRPCEKIVRLLAWVDPTRKKKTPRKQMKRWKCPWKIGGQIASQKQRVPSANPHQLSLPHYIKVIIQLFDSQNRLSTSGGLKGVLTFLGIPNHPVVDNHDLKLLCPGDHTRSIQGTEKSLPHRHCEWASRYGQL